jgi:UDP-2-acetamido-3-amino-2,3-dideoxy-glucuronate N-acetyltransferase
MVYVCQIFFKLGMAMYKGKIAVVGTGYWGKNLVRNFHELGALVGICDVNPAHAKALSEQFNVPAFDWPAVLASAEIEAVAVATPAETHFKMAYEALMAGKHVYVEKPLALNIEDAEKLCTLAKQRNLTLMVGHLLHYHPAFMKLKEMVRDGQLGRLQYVYSNRLSLGKIRREEDILWSFAPHDISMILSLVGTEPTSVRAEGAYYLHEKIADVTTTHMSFPGGERAHIFVSWLHPFKEQKLVVIGDKAMAVFDDTQDWSEKLVLYPHVIEWREGLPLPNKGDMTRVELTPAEPLQSECKHFVECVANKLIPRTDGEEGLRVLRVLTKASEALNVRLDNSKAAPASKADYFAHESAYVDEGVKIGRGTKIWHYSHILGKTKIGENCVIAQNVMIGPEVTVGNNCKIQNNVSLYKGIVLEDGVFCGPSCVFTNVNTPRAEIERKDEFLPTVVEKGCTIGANATIVCGSRLGAYSLIGAGAVVTKDIPAHALVVGNPAKQIGWVSHSGERLGEDLVCPREGRKYRVTENNRLEEVSNDSSSIKISA